jgi:hypothetical protein
VSLTFADECLERMPCCDLDAFVRGLPEFREYCHRCRFENPTTKVHLVHVPDVLAVFKYHPPSPTIPDAADISVWP